MPKPHPKQQHKQPTQRSTALDKRLSDAELAEAIRLLDSTGKGYLRFDDFISWWVNNKPAGAAKAAN